MKTVTLYKVEVTKAYQMREEGTHYSLEPWGDNTAYYEGTDDGGKEYALPDDGARWELANDKMGCPQLWRDDIHVSITSHGTKPYLVWGGAGSGGGSAVLKPAETTTITAKGAE